MPKNILIQSKKIESVKKNIRENFEYLDKDKSIDDFGFTPNLHDEQPYFIVTRNEFSKLSIEQENEDKKEKIEVTRLLIVRAILEKSNRMWQFLWNGNKISAPIIDKNFYDSFMSHKIQIAPGDMFEVELKIYMEKDENIGLYVNKEYEVIKVLKHIPVSQQDQLGI